VDGTLVPNGDLDALSAAMIELIDNPKKRGRYGTAAAAKAASYSMSSVGPRWDELLMSYGAARNGAQTWYRSSGGEAGQQGSLGDCGVRDGRRGCPAPIE
jgi:hypothetical protein